MIKADRAGWKGDSSRPKPLLPRRASARVGGSGERVPDGVQAQSGQKGPRGSGCGSRGCRGGWTGARCWRLADRQKSAPRYQAPPRTTRPEPDSGPPGSITRGCSPALATTATPFAIGRVVGAPGMAAEPCRIVAEAVGSRAVGAAGMFPLRLGQEAVGLAGLRAQPVAVGAGVVPTEADHRVAVVLIHVGLAPVRVGLLPEVIALVPDPGAVAGFGLGPVTRRRDEAPELPHRDRKLADGVMIEPDRRLTAIRLSAAAQALGVQGFSLGVRQG